MNLWEAILTLVVPLAAVIWGVNICHQRGLWLLAGWNTMGPEERETYHQKALCRLYGRCVALCGVGLFLVLYGSFQHRDLPLCLGVAIIAVLVLLSVVVPILHPKKYRKSP